MHGTGPDLSNVESNYLFLVFQQQTYVTMKTYATKGNSKKKTYCKNMSGKVQRNVQYTHFASAPYFFTIS